jgi:hypothetical protein
LSLGNIVLTYETILVKIEVPGGCDTSTFSCDSLDTSSGRQAIFDVSIQRSRVTSNARAILPPEIAQVTSIINATQAYLQQKQLAEDREKKTFAVPGNYEPHLVIPLLLSKKEKDAGVATDSTVYIDSHSNQMLVNNIPTRGNNIQGISFYGILLKKLHRNLGVKVKPVVYSMPAGLPDSPPDPYGVRNNELDSNDSPAAGGRSYYDAQSVPSVVPMRDSDDMEEDFEDPQPFGETRSAESPKKKQKTGRSHGV